jgi:hypothetical protein
MSLAPRAVEDAELVCNLSAGDLVCTNTHLLRGHAYLHARFCKLEHAARRSERLLVDDRRVHTKYLELLLFSARLAPGTV